MAWLIKGGRVMDPASGLDAELDVLVAGGRIAAVGTGLEAAAPGLLGSGSEEPLAVLEARGLVVAPGFIDLHAHLGEPGGEERETFTSATEAAAAGGFVAVAAMPDTEPPIEGRTGVEFVCHRAALAGQVRVLPVAALSKGRRGEELAEIGEAVQAGAVAVGDARPVARGDLMRRAMEYSRRWGVPVLAHAVDPSLAGDGVMHEGVTATLLGLRGSPAVAEEVAVARELLLAERTGARLHLQHVTTARAVALIREAKARGVAVTAEVTPHHLVLTDEAVRGYDPMARVEPPLRTAEDVLALREGLRDGTLDAIATDHTPCLREEKDVEFDLAAPGIAGLETAFALVWTELVATGQLAPATALGRLSAGPARVLGLAGGRLGAGLPADLVLFDPQRVWEVDPAQFRSRARNTPFAGRRLRGRVVHTLVGGRLVWREGAPVAAGVAS